MLSMVAFVMRYRKPLLVAMLVTAAVAGVLRVIHLLRTAEQRRVVAELALAGEKEIGEDLRARLTVNTLTTDSLGKALEAEKKLHGKTRAALKIAIAARETLIVEHEIPGTAVNGIRVANFRDSTFAGLIEGTVVAPEYPSPLRIGYTIHRPAFSPTIAFVQVGDTVVAAVHWQGEEARVVAPYWKSEYHRKPLQLFGDVSYTTSGWDVRAGPLLNLGNHIQPNAWVGYQGETRAGVGLRGVF